jgi:hypothetical protein
MKNQLTYSQLINTIEYPFVEIIIYQLWKYWLNKSPTYIRKYNFIIVLKTLLLVITKKFNYLGKNKYYYTNSGNKI